jgi:UPF0716 protein FxsA
VKGLWWKLGLAFTVIPTIELALLIWIGTQIGVLWTTLIVIGTGFTGAWLAKREGLGVLRQLQADLQSGFPPAVRIVEGVMVLIGAVLLITPGVLTDLTGFMLIFPLTRRLIAPWLLRRVLVWWTGNPAAGANIPFTSPFGSPPPRAAEPSPSRNPVQDPHFDHPVR